MFLCPFGEIFSFQPLGAFVFCDLVMVVHVDYLVIRCVTVIQLWCSHIQHGYHWDATRFFETYLCGGFLDLRFSRCKKSLKIINPCGHHQHQHPVTTDTLKDEALRGVVLCLLDTGHGRTAIEAVKTESCFLVCSRWLEDITRGPRFKNTMEAEIFKTYRSYALEYFAPLAGRQAPAGLRLS